MKSSVRKIVLMLLLAGFTGSIQSGSPAIPGLNGHGSEVPILDTPPVPTDFRVRAGIDTVVAWWENPYRFYQNHARTLVYRHTADEFDNAVYIGESYSVTYVDQDVMRDITYFYWIRWQSDTGVLGQPTDSFEVTTKESPSEAIDRISDEILDDPFIDALRKPIGPIPPIDSRLPIGQIGPIPPIDISDLTDARERYLTTGSTPEAHHSTEALITPGMNDAWVSADAALQGFFFTVYPDEELFFLSWFTFDSALPDASVLATFGAPDQRWVTGLGAYSDNSVTINVELTSGGIFNALEPLANQHPGYGTIIIVFINCNEALLAYSFPSTGLSGQMTLTRALPDNVALCEALSAA